MRLKLSLATLAVSFMLIGEAAAGPITDTDPIISGDLAGSTYGEPLIAANKVTTPKIDDYAVTSAKLAISARVWAKISSNGFVIAASKSGITVDRLSVGSYEINFHARLAPAWCATVATARGYGLSPQVLSGPGLHPLAETPVVVNLWDMYADEAVTADSNFDIVMLC